MLVATVFATAQTPRASFQAQAVDPADPLTLFGRMRPVFMHPRCANCHGFTDPVNDINHGGGTVGPNESCNGSGCHEAASEDWRIGGQLAGMDNRMLCQHIAMFVAGNPRDSLIRHLQNDELIKLAFVGLMGGASTSSPAPPPMTHDQFLDAAREWLEYGFASCDRDGTIVHTESITSDENQQLGPAIHNRFTQSGRRTVTIQFANGQYRADTITAHLGPEKHKRRDHYSVQDECGTGVRPSPAATERTTWQPTRFVIRGKLTNPRDRTRLVGRSQTVVTSRVPRDEEPWLHDHYGAAAQNGNLHPVTVHTTWNIRYRQ